MQIIENAARGTNSVQGDVVECFHAYDSVDFNTAVSLDIDVFSGNAGKLSRSPKKRRPFSLARSSEPFKQKKVYQYVPR